MTLVEVIIAFVVIGLVVWMFVRSYGTLRGQNQDHSIQLGAQQAFLGLSDVLEKTLSGCTAWKVETRSDGGTRLSVERGANATVVELYPERGVAEVQTSGKTRVLTFGISLAPPRGRLCFEALASGVALLVHRDKAPPLRLDRVFSVTLSTATDSRFFPEVEF